jgi:hypothetical protein
MTKAKARQRAKAKAAEKATKPAAKANPSGQEPHPGQFDPAANSNKGFEMKTNTKSFAGARRGGAARSR